MYKHNLVINKCLLLVWLCKLKHSYKLNINKARYCYEYLYEQYFP